MKAWLTKLRERAGRGAPAFGLAVLAGIALLAISELSYRQASRTMEHLGDSAGARLNVAQILRRVLEAESGQRGYLLTGRESYLQPVREATREVEQRIGELEARYFGERETTEVVRELEAQVRTRLSEIETVLSLHREGRHDSWRALLSADIGRERMEAFQQLAARLHALESDRIAEGRRTVFETLRTSRAGVFAMTAISLFALFLYLRQARALQVQRDAHRRQILAERDQLEAEVQRRTRQLSALARHLQQVREDERARLARELHDELGALLTVAKLDAARIRSRLAGAAPGTAETLEHLMATLNEGIALKGRIVEDLQPSALAQLGLAASLELLARDFGERAGIPVRCAAQPVPLRGADELTAYRVVQEALTNVARHAGARSVEVSLRARGGRAEIEVRDDGAGFDPARQPESAHGLTGMRHRVEAAGGALEVQSAPGRGTRILARLPLASEVDPTASPDAARHP
jgi:signal transduction histidine kinase